MAKNYLPAEIGTPRVCFTPGQAHLSGKINIGPAAISFYVSGTVDLTGTTPKVSGLSIKLGGVPDLGNITSQAEKAISDAINGALSDIKLSKKYNASFGAGSVTVQEVSP